MADPYDLDPHEVEPVAGGAAAPTGGTGGAAGSAAGATKLPSVLETQGVEACPRCGKPLEGDAVVCVGCGYDMKANTVRTTVTGTVEAPDPAADPSAPFVTPGWPGWRMLTISGGVLLVLALVASGSTTAAEYRGSGFFLIVGSILLTLYWALLHTGTGIVAVVIAAKLEQKKVGRLDLAAARVFCALSAFLLISSLHLPALGWFIGHLVLFGLGAVVYFAFILLFFRKDARQAGLICGAHMVLFAVIWAGTNLASSIDRAEAPVATAPAPMAPASLSTSSPPTPASSSTTP